MPKTEFVKFIQEFCWYKAHREHNKLLCIFWVVQRQFDYFQGHRSTIITLSIKVSQPPFDNVGDFDSSSGIHLHRWIPFFNIIIRFITIIVVIVLVFVIFILIISLVAGIFSKLSWLSERILQLFNSSLVLNFWVANCDGLFKKHGNVCCLENRNNKS